ncbi:hypothetical protein [Spiroplasma endosymbiont of Diplazon laetatorius]|uniref:hypothetical protein n=1 Tax=Spiroplasma endosymbiont of Diplazon laetatorius TaxID=3066322 RepID=UPI0030D58F35
MNKIEKPEFKWYFGLPFSKVWNKGAKDYYKDRELYDLSLMSESKKVRYFQAKVIYDTDTFFYLLVTTIWSLLPPLIDLPDWLNWMSLGMKNFGFENWGNQIALTLIPAGVGTIIHKLPNFIPSKKGRIIVEIILKLLPVLLLILSSYLIKTEKQYRSFKKIEKENLYKEVIGQNTT